MEESKDDEIDMELYDRQAYVFGIEAMKSLSKVSVLICGLGGLGVETAKNLILAGPKQVSLWDPTECSSTDLSSQYYISESDYGKSRAEVSTPKLGELNGYVRVTLEESLELTDQVLKKYQVVVFCNVSGVGIMERVSSFCHNNNISFISAESRGLFGNVFVDLGQGFVVKDVDGEVREAYVITSIDEGASADTLRVTIAESSRIEFQTDAVVAIKEIKGAAKEGSKNLSTLNDKLLKATVIGPQVVDVNVPRAEYGDYLSGGVIQEIKQPKTIDFLEFKNALQTPGEFAMVDWGKFDRPPQLHLGFQALRSFTENNKGQLPRLGNTEDLNNIIDLAKKINEDNKKEEGFISVEKIDEKLITSLADGCRGNLNAMCAYLGGIIAQEVVKVTGKFHPINQFYYFDALECLPEPAPSLEDRTPKGSRYDGQALVLGHSFTEKLRGTKAFLVGAGALGCELLKNFACMGLGTNEDKGYIQVTDLDSIEKSNLNRQFLFRAPDIGGMKSICAARAVKRMNNDLNVHAHETPVGKDTEDVFHDEFWEDLDIVINGLDNIQARLYVDERCVEFKKPLLESGTLGTKANTQVIVPHLTEHYGASKDAPEKQIAVCTEKHFPYKIEHTIQFSKNLFLKEFTEVPTDVNNYLDDPKFCQNVIENNASPNVQREKFESVKVHLDLLNLGEKLTFDILIQKARQHFETQFKNLLLQLLFNFPANAKTRDGNRFWAPPKRPPIPLEFNAEEETISMFIYSTACIWAALYGIKEESFEYVKKISATSKVDVFKPKAGVKIKEKDEDEIEEGQDNDEKVVEDIVKALPKPELFEGRRLNVQEFEKDVDSNHHIDFIASAANLRARNYEITEITRHGIKGIAGKIIPAVATTTSMITGLVCFELLKVLQNRPVEHYKNAYVSLAIPIAAFSEPLAPEKSQSTKGDPEVYGCEPKRCVPEGWTIWDTIDVNGDVTVQELIDSFAKEYNAEVTAIASGNYQLYQPFFPAHAARLPKKITQVWKDVNKSESLPKGKNYLELIVLCDDLDDDEIEVDMPTIRIYWKK